MSKTKSVSITKKEMALLGSLGNRIKTIRERKKLELYEITGEECPIKSRQHWQAIENGKKNINITTLFRIAETLSVDVSDLL
jgi:transcriptional regulator with XRE-family HTH domain